MTTAQRTRIADVSEKRIGEKRKCPPHDRIGTAAKALSDQRLAAIDGIGCLTAAQVEFWIPDHGPQGFLTNVLVDDREALL
jgi:hypothetical protein